MTVNQPTCLLSITSAAEQLDCSRGHIYGLVAAGKLRVVEIKATGSKSKSRIRRDDLAVFVESMTRGTAPAARAPVRRPELWSHAAVTGGGDRGVYSAVQAAERAEVAVSTVYAALRDGALRGGRRTPSSHWRIDHCCLTAWIEGGRCDEHGDGGGAGEVRRVDGT